MLSVGQRRAKPTPSGRTRNYGHSDSHHEKQRCPFLAPGTEEECQRLTRVFLNYLSLSQSELARATLHQLSALNFRRAAEILKNVVLLGPPASWLFSVSVPSSAHLSWMCYEEYESIIVQHTGGYALVPHWVRRRLEFDLILAQAMLDAATDGVEPFAPDVANEIRALNAVTLGVQSKTFYATFRCPACGNAPKRPTAVIHISPANLSSSASQGGVTSAAANLTASGPLCSVCTVPDVIRLPALSFLPVVKALPQSLCRLSPLTIQVSDYLYRFASGQHVLSSRALTGLSVLSRRQPSLGQSLWQLLTATDVRLPHALPPPRTSPTQQIPPTIHGPPTSKQEQVRLPHIPPRPTDAALLGPPATLQPPLASAPVSSLQSLPFAAVPLVAPRVCMSHAVIGALSHRMQLSNLVLVASALLDHLRSPIQSVASQDDHAVPSDNVLASHSLNAAGSSLGTFAYPSSSPDTLTIRTPRLHQRRDFWLFLRAIRFSAVAVAVLWRFAKLHASGATAAASEHAAARHALPEDDAKKAQHTTSTGMHPQPPHHMTSTKQQPPSSHTALPPQSDNKSKRLDSAAQLPTAQQPRAADFNGDPTSTAPPSSSTLGFHHPVHTPTEQTTTVAPKNHPQSQIVQSASAAAASVDVAASGTPTASAITTQGPTNLPLKSHIQSSDTGHIPDPFTPSASRRTADATDASKPQDAPQGNLPHGSEGAAGGGGSAAVDKASLPHAPPSSPPAAQQIQHEFELPQSLSEWQPFVEIFSALSALQFVAQSYCADPSLFDAIIQSCEARLTSLRSEVLQRPVTAVIATSFIARSPDASRQKPSVSSPQPPDTSSPTKIRSSHQVASSVKHSPSGTAPPPSGGSTIATASAPSSSTFSTLPFTRFSSRSSNRAIAHRSPPSVAAASDSQPSQRLSPSRPHVL